MNIDVIELNESSLVGAAGAFGRTANRTTVLSDDAELPCPLTD